MTWFRSILYFLFFTILLPGELLIWGMALDSQLKGSYLSRKILLNPLFDYPKNWGLLIVLFLTVVTVWEQVRTIHFAEVTA